MRSLGVHLTPGSATGLSLPAGGGSVPVGSTSDPSGRVSGEPDSCLAELLARNAGAVDDVVVDVGRVIDGWLSEPRLSRLARVVAVRIAPASDAIRTPFIGWPPRVASAVDGGFVAVRGGVDMYGRSGGELDRALLDRAVVMARDGDADAICISANGALLDPEPELQAAEHILSQRDPPRVVMSHVIGGRRFLERERATLVSGAMMAGVEDLLDRLTDIVRRHRVSLALAGADGSRLTLQDARSRPASLFGTTKALVAQGAAALAGVDSATVVVWMPHSVRLLTLDRGTLRARQVRTASALSGMRLTQRHAAQAKLIGAAIPADAIRASAAHPVMVVSPRPRGANAPPEFQSFIRSIQVRPEDVIHVSAPMDELAAVGAAVALPQCEIERFAIIEGEDGAVKARRENLRVAQGRVIGEVGGQFSSHTVIDQCQPLSFLDSGPFLVHTMVVGRPLREEP